MSSLLTHHSQIIISVSEKVCKSCVCIGEEVVTNMFTQSHTNLILVQRLHLPLVGEERVSMDLSAMD